MTARAFLLATLLSSACATGALAQDRGSQADQDACTPDVFRLCSAYIPNEAPIVACLKANRRALSPACHQVFYPASRVPSVKTADATPTGTVKVMHKHHHYMKHHVKHAM